jgi:hypothetical protein
MKRAGRGFVVEALAGGPRGALAASGGFGVGTEYFKGGCKAIPWGSYLYREAEGAMVTAGVRLEPVQQRAVSQWNPHTRD